jgi:hypothetical protein
MLSSGALSSLGLGGVLITLGYSAGRQTTIDVTDLIWKTRADGRLLSVRPIADADRHGMEHREETRIGTAMPLIDLTYPENALSNSGVHRLSQTTLCRSRFLSRRYTSHICA